MAGAPWTVQLVLLLALLRVDPMLARDRPSSLSHACTCAASSPQQEDDLGALEVRFALTSSRMSRLHCCPTRLFPHHHPADTYNITWRFEGEVYPWSLARNSFQEGYCGAGTLESDGVRVSDDGNYTCTVTSSAGASITRTYVICVNVNDKLGRRPVRPDVSGTTHALPGEEVTLVCSGYVGRPHCLAGSPPTVDLTWVKENPDGSWTPCEDLPSVRVNTSDNSEGVVRSSLVVARVRSLHYGRYACTLTNAHGNVTLYTSLLKGVVGAVREGREYRAALLVLVAACVLLVVVLAWRRCKLTYALYYRVHKPQQQPPAGEAVWDVVVVHGEGATDWVWRVLVPTLEQHLHYTCFLPQRDLCGGQLLVEEVAGEVGRSRRLVVVVTPCLLNNPWAAWALHHALHHALHARARALALVLKDPVKEQPPVNDPSGILGLLKLVPKLTVPYCCGYDRLDPEDQRLTNMIAGSREVLQEGKLKAGAGGAGLRVQEDCVEAREDDTGLQDPGSPSSITPFIWTPHQPASSHKHTSVMGAVWGCLKVLCAADRELVLWRSLQYHLGPPLALARQHEQP